MRKTALLFAIFLLSTFSAVAEDPPAENQAPEVPTELSPTGTTDSKIFSAQYSDPEEEMGSIEFRIFSVSPADCSLDDDLVVSGSSEPVVSGSTAEKEFENLEDGEYFWCARSFDGELNSDFTEVQNFTLDTFVPQIFTVAEPGEVVINEVAWAGSTASANDEWAELRSMSDKIFDLSDWQIVAEDGTPSIMIEAGKQLQPGEFFLLERTDDTSVPDVSADQIYTGALGNGGEVLVLFDSAGTEIDRVDGSNAWAGGDSSSRKTFSRAGSEFRESSEADGTPRAANFHDHDVAVAELSASPATPLSGEETIFTAELENHGLNTADFEIVWKVDGEEISRETIQDLESFGVTTKNLSQSFEAGSFEITVEIEFSADEDPTNDSASLSMEVANHLLINEFIPNPEGSDEVNEWIEIYNPTEDAILLEGFELNGASIIGEIAPGEYLVFTAELDGWDAMPNSSGEVILKNAEGEIIDQKSYENAVEKKSFGRSSSDINTWTEFWHPTPGLENVENNGAPVAQITIQNSGNTSGQCSLYVNLTAEDSSDADGDDLAYEWDFGNGSSSDEENPSGFYLNPGDYTVTLTVTDVFGESVEATQLFTVSGCSSGGGGGGGSSTQTDNTDEPVFDSISTDSVEMVINEVSFDSDNDWIEVLMLDDGNSGAGADIGGFYFEIDKRIKTIPQNTKLKTGEFLLLTFKSSETDSTSPTDGVWKIFSDNSGITKTDEQVTLRDATGRIEDAVAWENRNGKWSPGEEADITEIVAGDGWISTKFEDMLDSSLIEREDAIARLPDSTDTNSAVDWFITSSPTPGAANSTSAPEPMEDLTMVSSNDIRISEILPNPVGKDADLEWFELNNMGDTEVDLLGWSVMIGDSIFEFEDSLVLQPGEFRSFPGLLTIRNAGDTITLLDFEGTVIDSLEYPEMQEGESFARKWNGEFAVTDVPTPDRSNCFYRFLPTDEDADADGLSDAEELELGTDPENFDTDGDGLSDGFEIYNGFDPKTADASSEDVKKFRQELQMLATLGFTSEVSQADGVFLSGAGVPGGRIRIYIHSQLEIVEVEVGDDGTWSYVLDKELEAGTHHVFTQLISPNGVEGVANKVLNFGFQEDFNPPEYAETLRISEVLPDSEGDDAAGEFVEIENFGDAEVSLENYQLSVGRKTFIFPSESMIQPKSFLALSREESGLTLTNSGSEVALSLPTHRVISELTYEKAKEGVALAWNGENFTPTKTPTPAAINKISTSDQKPAKKVQTYANGDISSAIQISEVLANPNGDDSDEWIEIWSSSTIPVNLGNWRLDDSPDGSRPFVIPDSITLQPGEFRIFPKSLTKLALNNSGNEAVRLFDYTGKLVSEVTFRDPREGVALALENSEFRETEIPTPGLANKFDTQKIKGTVRFVGQDGFVIESLAGELFIKFAEGNPGLLARALLRENEEWEIFAEDGENGLTLKSFKVAPSLLRSDLLAVPQSSSTNNAPPVLLLVFIFCAIIFLFRIFARLGEVWESRD